MVFEEVQNPYCMVNMKERKLQGSRVDAKRKVIGERKKEEKEKKKKKGEKETEYEKEKTTKIMCLSRLQS